MNANFGVGGCFDGTVSGGVVRMGMGVDKMGNPVPILFGLF
jgi:hypothetical protein